MKTAFLFPGQGAQSVGMGKDLLEGSDVAKEVYNLVDSIYAEITGLSHKISEMSLNGPEEELKKTINTQPAILALSLALAKIAKNDIEAGKLAKPSFVAGHSLGEFAALYMAGVLSLEDAVKLVCKRGQLMENAPKGAMTAIVGLEETKLDEIIKEVQSSANAEEAKVSVANYNSPDQIVITGSPEGVKAAENKVNEFAEANSLKVRVIPLVVGGAFHSPLMAEPSAEFAKLIDEANFANAEIPIIQNFSAKAVTDAAEIKANLKEQMTGSVRWTETVKQLITADSQNKVESILELGPGKVLAGLVKKQERRFPVTSIQGLEDYQKALESLLTQAA